MIAEETFTILSQLTGSSLSAAEVENLFLYLNAENAFAPMAMVTGLVEMLQLRNNKLVYDENFESVFSDILARDRHTGYYIHPALRTLYLDFAMVRGALPGQDNKNFLILGDYLNLSSVNDAIGRSATNDVMATICGIYLDCMTRAGVVNWLYHRSMGDEITFIVVNTPEERVRTGLREAEKLTEEFVDALGLERLRHKKYPNQYGTSLITAYVPLTARSSHRELKQQLDEAVQVHKKNNKPSNWFRFKRRGIEPEQFHNRSSEQRIDKALHKYRDYRNQHQSTPESEAGIGARNPLQPVKSLLIGRAIAWPRDDRIEYLRHHHDDTKTMLRADIYNLSGLNSIYGHDGADHIKSHLIRILYSTITAHNIAEPKIFDCGGGIIDVVINAMPTSQLHKLIEVIQNNIYYQILSQKISEYAETYNLSFAGAGELTLAELPHPRHENKGTGLIMATHPVESKRSLPEIIERLDKITHRTKMHDFAYLWVDENCHVYALPLNEVPEAISIGNDRKEQNMHYLPFTEALQHYLKHEDLPIIFEKPVGQICETLFGTDMQAVLGFKKAISKLQDKGIPDDDIEKISSYEEMDKRLISEELPPLSVFSTQARPVFVSNEREAFKTMTLAEKLEGLPKNVTSLILQAQASFRTLKIVQPHGFLQQAHAIQILQEEMIHLPANIKQRQLTENLYSLARLLDRTATTIGKDLPDTIRESMTDFSLEVLKDLAIAFDSVEEPLLAEKFREYVLARKARAVDRLLLLTVLQKEVAVLVEKLAKKHVLSSDQCHTLLVQVTQLLAQLREYTQSHSLMVEASCNNAA